SGSSSESAVTLKSEPQEPLEFPGQEPAGNSGRIKAEPPSPGQSCEEVKAASLHPKLFGNDRVPSPPAQVGVAPGRSRFPVIPKSPTLQRAASAPASSKSPKFRKNNYTWVANPGRSSRLVRRWGSPRAESARKGLGAAERGAKTSPRADLGAKAKKAGLQSKLGVSPSKYKWKASSLQALPSTSKSAFRWRSEEQRKPPAPDIPRPGAAPPAPSAASVGLGAVKSFGEAPLSSYKVKSRTKIIKRKGNVGFPTDKKNTSPSTALKSRFHLRRKNSVRGKTSAMPKRSSPRILVQVSRHRLCRIPPTRTQVASKEGSSFPFARSPPSNKVIKTRYRIVKKNVAPPALSSFTSPIPTWKTRRPGTSR
ncbi:ZC3H3 protein, partial [Piprites chloris]|nr:ZC3H3 protein [Piprites chloris]